MQTFVELLKREFRLFWGNKVLLLLFIGAPVMYGILLGYVYGKGKVTDLPVVVVDMDRSSMSDKAIEMMNDNEVIHVARIVYDETRLDEVVAKNEAVCVIFFPKDFERDVLTRRNPEILTLVNTSNVLTANYGASAIQLVLGTLKAGTQMETLRKQGIPEELLMSQYEPFKTTFIKRNNRSTNYMYFLWPGILATVLQQVLLLGLALSFASEFENGTFAELSRRTRSTLEMIAVKVVPYLMMSFGIWILYYLFTLWFRIPFHENLDTLTLIAGVFVLAVSFIGILVSILIPNQLKATEVLMVIATPSFILSGFTWPLSQMPVWVQWIAQVIPLTHFLPAFRILVVENGAVDLTYPYILNMLLIALAGLTLSYVLLHFKRKNTLNAAPGGKQIS